MPDIKEEGTQKLEGFKSTLPTVHKKGDEKVIFLQLEEKRVYDYWQQDIRRMERNNEMTWATGYKQWPDDVVAKLKEQGRYIPQFNILGEKLHVYAGQILQNWYDMKYEPMTGDINSLTLKLQDMYYADKDQMKWDAAKNTALVHGLGTGVGILQMGISNRLSDMGNISLENVNPFYFLFDPNWETEFSRDMEKCWKFAWLTPAEIKRIYKAKGEELDAEHIRQAKDGEEYGEFIGAYPIRDLDRRWGSKHKVIEKNYLVTEKRIWEYDFKNKQYFPETGYPFHSPEDILIKRLYIQQMGLNEESDIDYVDQERRIAYKTTIVPTLSQRMLLQDEERSKIQVDRLEYFPWGAYRNGQQWKGIVDDLISIQIGININEKDMAEIREKAAKAPFFWDPELFDSDPELMKQAILKYNQPGAKIKTAPGALAGGGKFIQELEKTAIGADYFRLTDHLYEMGDRFSTPAAAGGRTEGRGESGKLFESKYEAGLIANVLMNKGLEQREADIAEAYMLQAKITYAGHEREFPAAGGKEGFIVNERFPSPFSGIAIKNDISKLPRQKVVITPSPKGLTIKTDQRNMYSDVIKSLSPFKDAALPIATYLDFITDTLEMPDERKDEAKRAMGLYKETAALTLQAAKNQAQLTILQQIPQIKQMMEELRAQGVSLPQNAEEQKENPPDQVTFESPAKGGAGVQADEGTPQQTDEEAGILGGEQLSTLNQEAEQ